jgi:hypothetical protein
MLLGMFHNRRRDFNLRIEIVARSQWMEMKSPLRIWRNRSIETNASRAVMCTSVIKIDKQGCAYRRSHMPSYGGIWDEIGFYIVIGLLCLHQKDKRVQIITGTRSSNYKDIIEITYRHRPTHGSHFKGASFSRHPLSICEYYHVQSMTFSDG